MLPGELAELLSHPPLALISKQTAAERGRVVTRATMRITGGLGRRRKLADNKTGGDESFILSCYVATGRYDSRTTKIRFRLTRSY